MPQHAMIDPGLWRLVDVAAIAVCIACRRYAIGGWLLYFFLRVFGGLLQSMWALIAEVQRYEPDREHGLALASTAPDAVAWVALAAVCVMLLKTREWNWVISLRAALGLKITVGFTSCIIEARYLQSESRLAWDGRMVLMMAAFLSYFFVSKRVQHVFKTKDWEALYGGLPSHRDRRPKAEG